ncbi:class I SAM-dependent DNA methyltransferase [Anaeropeptidivorans aminofermentans]|jgi:SAM-dependent methyltransferase|uniref:class I SAM-dependent DNA methyltransferase n=1 Tax=Anaeropeptidivorans aminofermentans TaxID=2934315 RepID=UPI002024E373|nr:class I SAM-dependent methyltransferase [Anaeropeptidivorans aminofermentans]
MRAYGKFAKVYDLFMENDNELRVAFLENIWIREGTKPSLILDLCCGTGEITSLLHKKGYDMTGIDISEEMLSVARQRDNSPEILYLQQDMREFELYGTVDSILCLSDGLNYLLEPSEVMAVLRLVKNYLNPGGTFIFDINTEHKFKNILGEHNFSAAEDNAAYIWENYYDEEEKINEYMMTFFIKDEETGLFERFQEAHYERAYGIDELSQMLTALSFEIKNIYGGYSGEALTDFSERAVFVCKR